MNEFNIAVAESAQYKSNLTNIGDYKYYYSQEYGEKIKKYLLDKKVDSKECAKQSLRSASSSARLCANYFFDCQNVVLEKPIHNDVSNTPTKMDAVDSPTFYECKCQEIVNGEHELLRKSYWTKKTSLLFKEFNIQNIKIEKHFNSKSKNDFDFCDFSLNDLGVDYPGKYYEINFNVKQLLCHLIAIAHDYPDKERKTLKYIIFRPKIELIEKSKALTELYERVNNQFVAICNSENIKRFVAEDNHNIRLILQYVNVDKITEHFGD